MLVSLNNTSDTAASATKLVQVCPHCGSLGTFLNIIKTFTTHKTGHSTFQIDEELGLAKCPNPACCGQLFYVVDRNRNSEIKDTYPKLRIPFKTNNIPKKILAAFEEAITCYANNCYMASAIMVRKTLEEICHDRNATGANLYRRIEALKGIVTLPPPLLAGIHELRLIGNDAAHVDLETFPEIGPEELELAIDFTKELLKGIYQYDDLLGRFSALRQKTKANQP